MSSFRFLFALCLFPILVALGFWAGWRTGSIVTAIFLLFLSWRARKLGSGLGTVLLGLGRSYLVVPRLVRWFDLRAARRACGVGATPRVTWVGATMVFTDLPEIETRELLAAIERAHASLADLLPTSRPADRVLLFARQDAMRAYLRGWFGELGVRAAGFFFRAGPSRVVGAVDVFRALGRDPRALLAHELVHAALRSVSGAILHYRWLDEGLAEALALTWFEPGRRPGVDRFLRRLKACGYWHDFAQLSGWKAGHVVKGLKTGDSEAVLRVHAFYAQACAVMLAVLDTGPQGRAWLLEALRRPTKAKRALRERLQMDGEALLARAEARVDVATLELTPFDRARRSVLRELIAQAPPSPFRVAAVMGLAACGDTEDLPLLGELARSQDEEVASAARLVVQLIERCDESSRGA